MAAKGWEKLLGAGSPPIGGSGAGKKRGGRRVQDTGREVDAGDGEVRGKRGTSKKQNTGKTNQGGGKK